MSYGWWCGPGCDPKCSRHGVGEMTELGGAGVWYCVGSERADLGWKERLKCTIYECIKEVRE